MHPLKAVLFGAIGTVAETSDLQRRSFNAAFAEAGLNWHWSADQYVQLLTTNGGQTRLRDYRDADASRRGVSDALIEQLHHAKTQHYVRLTQQAGAVKPRPGVCELMRLCLDAGVKLAWCTSTSLDNVASIQQALTGQLPVRPNQPIHPFDPFDVVVTIDKIARVKPAPDSYLYALHQLGLSANQVVAIEDTPVSISAAKAAGIYCVATPGATTVGQDFSQADWVLPDLAGLTLSQLNGFLAAG